ncbi:MAG: radical SAM protein [Verrucomicrobiae bacterium]|nr:radical SAM protein [Verrucomicrobiae bacterium]
MAEANSPIAAHRDHRRSWRDFLYVYPVVSRRSRGVSLGINLNPDQVCNFDCVYCEVDRRTPPRVRKVELPVLERELRALLDAWKSGELFRDPPFSLAPPETRRLNDLAFSGDGEPTTFGPFAEACALVARVKRETVGDAVKIVLITDAAGLDRDEVKRGLEILDANHGEVWGKLDAGTEAYYRLVNRSHVRFDRILANLENTGKKRPICIQSLFLKIRGEGPPPDEIAAYCGRLKHFIAAGCKIREVQAYTVARPTPEAWATSLSPDALEALAARIRAETVLKVVTYP